MMIMRARTRLRTLLRAVQWLQRQGSTGGTGRNERTGARAVAPWADGRNRRSTVEARVGRRGGTGIGTAVGIGIGTAVGIGIGTAVGIETAVGIGIGTAPTVSRTLDAGGRSSPAIGGMPGGGMKDAMMEVVVGETIAVMKGARTGDTTADMRRRCMMRAMSVATVDGTSIILMTVGRERGTTGETIA